MLPSIFIPFMKLICVSNSRERPHFPCACINICCMLLKQCKAFILAAFNETFVQMSTDGGGFIRENNFFLFFVRARMETRMSFNCEKGFCGADIFGCERESNESFYKVYQQIFQKFIPPRNSWKMFQVAPVRCSTAIILFTFLLTRPQVFTIAFLILIQILSTCGHQLETWLVITRRTTFSFFSL